MSIEDLVRERLNQKEATPVASSPFSEDQDSSYNSRIAPVDTPINNDDHFYEPGRNINPGNLLSGCLCCALISIMSAFTLGFIASALLRW